MTISQRVLFLIGSPRGKKSSSTAICSYLLKMLKQKSLLNLETLWIGFQLKSPAKIGQMLDAVDSADIIVLAAPLYDDCEPYIVIKTMELIAARRKEKIERSDVQKNHVFTVIVNCAFPEEHHNHTVLKIYRKFAKDSGFIWGGSIAISAGEMLRGRYGKSLDDAGSIAKKLKKSLEGMAESFIKGDPAEDATICLMPPAFYRGPFSFIGALFNWLGNRNWASLAKKKGQDVNARPYI